MADTRIIVRGRLSYVHLFKPHAAVQGQEEKYSTTILIDKRDTKTKLKIDAAIKAAEEYGISDRWGGVRPVKINSPLKDGDGTKEDGTPYGDECKGCWVINASAKVDYPPQVVNGIYANVSINFYHYAYMNKRGIGVGLGNVQKIKDGESLAGGRNAQQDFQVVEDDDMPW